MLLQRLVEYSRNLPHTPTLYSEAPIRYHIALDQNGRLLRMIDTADAKNPQTKNGQRRLAPRVKRTSGVKPLLLSDTAEYTLGVLGEGAKPARVGECHRSYLEQVERCASATHEPEVEAVQRFLSSDPLAQLSLPADFNAGANVTFRVGERYVVDIPAVQTFWADENSLDSDAESPAARMQCIVCGEQRQVLTSLQTSVKGVPGGQPSGTAIISANKEAFESYGLERSLVAPTCSACGESFTRAINSLLAERSHHINLGGAALIFWTREQHAFSLRDWLDDPQPDQVRALVEAARAGKDMPKVDETAFYAAVLSGSGGRAVVRDWIDTTVAETKRRLAGWFAGQSMVGAYGDPPRPLGIYTLAASTVRDANKDLAPITPRALWRSALTRTPLPLSLLSAAVQRSRAERKITFQRATLIKLVLCTREQDHATRRRMEDTMTQLDLSNDSPAYLCGRLLAVLERAQRLAVGKVGSNVVDRFYGTASSAPATVFGTLMDGVQAHLSKLRDPQPGAHGAIQKQIQDILAGLPAFPRVLTLEQQGLFALGYYHQRAFDSAQMKEAAERRRADAAANEVEKNGKGE